MKRAFGRIRRYSVGKSKSDLVFDVFVYSLTVVLLIVVYPLYFVVIASISDPLSVLTGM